MINRTLQRQLRQWEELDEKDQLLNPRSRANYFKKKREKEITERLSKEYYHRNSMMGR